MLSKRIAILSILESHSDNDQIKKLNTQYNPNLHFMHSHNTENPRSKGIVIVTNRNHLKNIPMNLKTITPGRALSFSINWPNNNTINLLAVYAPNVPNDNMEFWNNMCTKIENNETPAPNIMIRDFNMVKEASDCLPPHPDPIHMVEALRDLKGCLGLTDGWHHINPFPDHGYTFEQPSGGSHSCIDRIYVTEDIFNCTLDWKLIQLDVTTDHQMISIWLYDLSVPNIRRGRWALPKYLIEDENFLQSIEKMAKCHTHTSPNGPTHNPQRYLQDLINEICMLAKHMEKIKAGKMNSMIKNLTNRRNMILQKVNNNDPE